MTEHLERINPTKEGRGAGQATCLLSTEEDASSFSSTPNK